MSDNATCECPVDGVDLLIQARKDFAASMFLGNREEILKAMDDVRAARKALGKSIRRLDHLLGHPTRVSASEADGYFCNQIADCSGAAIGQEGGAS